MAGRTRTEGRKAPAMPIGNDTAKAAGCPAAFLSLGLEDVGAGQMSDDIQQTINRADRRSAGSLGTSERGRQPAGRRISLAS